MDEFVQPQLAQLQSQPPHGEGWIHEIKFDGYRTVAYVDGKTVKLQTRSGLNWTEKYPSVAEALRKMKLRKTLLDGEICYVGEDGRSDFQKLQNALKAGDSTHLVYFVFDLLEMNGKDLREKTQLERKEHLANVLQFAPSNVRLAEHWKVDPDQLLSASCHLGLEGLISKREDATYESGRTRNWIKSKCTKAQEFVIGGYSASSSGAPFGSLLLGVFDRAGRKFRYIGKVGTGFTQATLRELAAKFKSLRQPDSPFVDGKAPRSGVTWLKPRLVAQINFTEFTSEGSLRHPSFQGLREDKPARQVRLET